MKKELQRAIVQQQHIEIIYLGSQGSTSKRIIRPLEIAGDRLKAYCLQRRAPRVFIIDSILAIQPPTIDVLCVKTGRDRGGVMTVLEVLAREKYIEWNRSNPDHMVVIEGWERKDDVRWRGR